MKDNDCIFCLLANGDIPTSKVYEDEEVAVILDAGPATRGHALVLPKDHFRDITEVPAGLLGKMMNVAARVGEAQKSVLGATGFNTLANTGASAGQSVFHCHIHVIPRYDGEPRICAWTPGKANPEESRKIAADLAAVCQTV